MSERILYWDLEFSTFVVFGYKKRFKNYALPCVQSWNLFLKNPSQTSTHDYQILQAGT